MSYNQVQLLDEVRNLYLPDTPEQSLPDNVIIMIADKVNNDPRYSGDYPYIVWLTTLRCLDYLIARSTVQTGGSGSAEKSSRKEKSGDWEITVTQESSSTEGAVGVQGYKDLKALYLESPSLFGILPSENSGTTMSTIMFGGVSKKEYEELKKDSDRLFYSDEWDWLEEANQYKKNLRI